MDIINAMKSRISTRNFEFKEIEQEKIVQIKDTILNLEPLHKEIKTSFILIQEEKVVNEEIMKGFIGSYGKVRSPYCILCVSENKEKAHENIGFMGEQLVIALTAMGLGTCWIGGGFDKENTMKYTGMEFAVVPAVLALGYPKEPLSTRNLEKTLTRRKKIEDIFFYKQYKKNILNFFNTNQNFKEIGELCRIYPSAVNYQPARMILDEKEAIIMISNKALLAHQREMQKIDGGIFLAHLYLACKAYGKDGQVVMKEESLERIPKGHCYIASYVFE